MDKTVVKALKLLEALAASDRARGVTDLADDLALTKANVHRLLRTLLEQGYVSQSEESLRYCLSLKMWEVGSRAVQRLELTDAARPFVRALCADAGESVQLAILEGTTVAYIDKADSPHPLRAITQVGGRSPGHCVSAGKAILAFSEDLAGTLRFPLARYTPQTLVTRDELMQEFASIRKNGFAVNRNEWRLGVWGIAAPIRDVHGSVVAAIGVWGSEVRFRGAVSRLGRLVIDAAAGISAALGHLGTDRAVPPRASGARRKK